jgi:hypothetical protein
MKKRTWSVLRNTVSTVKKSHASTPLPCARRNSPQVGAVRRGARPRPAPRRIRRTVLAPTRIPSLRSSSWILTHPHLGFSLPIRMMRSVVLGPRGGLEVGSRRVHVLGVEHRLLRRIGDREPRPPQTYAREDCDGRIGAGELFDSVPITVPRSRSHGDRVAIEVDSIFGSLGHELQQSPWVSPSLDGTPARVNSCERAPATVIVPSIPIPLDPRTTFLNRRPLSRRRAR